MGPQKGPFDEIYNFSSFLTDFWIRPKKLYQERKINIYDLYTFRRILLNYGVFDIEKCTCIVNNWALQGQISRIFRISVPRLNIDVL